jgi:DNA-binding LacI/PurR family transcriptional regulator
MNEFYMRLKNKKPTIKDIAQLCNVSISTVSYALNNSSKVRPEKRELIKSVVRQLNYVPHDLAKSLASGNSNTIGLNMPFHNPFFVEITEKIARLIHQNGYSVLISIWQDSADHEKDLNMLVQKSLSGIISGPIFGSYNNILFDVYNKYSIPTVAIGHWNDLNIPQVDIDYQKAIFLSTEHLIKLGHKKIGYLCLHKNAKRWLAGFKDALLKYSWKYYPEWLIEGLGNRQMGYEKMKAILESGKKDLPSAFVCHNDLCAAGAIKALSEKGLKVPDDISITGVNNIEAGMYSIPTLTTLDMKIDLLVNETFNQLKKQIDSQVKLKESEIERVLIEPELIIRGSTTSFK